MIEHLKRTHIPNQQSFASHSHRSRSKRGITVTLSKQKSSHQNKSNKHQNTHNDQSLNDAYISAANNTDSYYQQSHQKNSFSNIFDTINIESVSTNINRPQENIHDNYLRNKKISNFTTDNLQYQKLIQQVNKQNVSPKSNLVGAYLTTTQQKIAAKKESDKLDERIKRLQQQIYKTRSKITQTKYLCQTVNNVANLSDKSNNLTVNKKVTQQRNRQIIKKDQKKSIQSFTPDNIYALSQNFHNKFNSPKKPIKQKHKISHTQEIPISPSSQDPPHPYVLRQMIASQKQTVKKVSNDEDNSTIKILSQTHPEIKFEKQQLNKNINNSKFQMIDDKKVTKKVIKLNQQVQNKKKDVHHSKIQIKKLKSKQQEKNNNKKIQKESDSRNKKRSYSLNLQERFKGNQKKSKNQSMLSSKNKKKKPASKFNLESKAENYLQFIAKNHKQPVPKSNYNIQQIYSKNGQIFSNKVLTKKVSSQKRKRSNSKK